MKILKGSLRNKSILLPASIRATSSRVKKSLFDVLGDELEGARVLDLFAGSGALGIEALSQGADQAVFVDFKPASLTTIKKNLASLKLTGRTEVILKDATKAIKDFKAKSVYFDVVFLDPPYYKGILRKTLQTLDDYDIVNAFGYIVCLGYYKDEVLREGKHFSLIFANRYGQTLLLIYRYNAESDLSGDI